MLRTTFVICAALLSVSLTTVVADDVQKPNIILINCDDLGYGDIGCMGSVKHRTPNIDQLSVDGLTLTDFYVTSGVCTPSRSSLMTGCYPKRTGMHTNGENKWVLFPGNRQGLNPGEVTIAEQLKQAGYVTAIIGKWHLGDQPEFLPTRQGFDTWFGIPYSNDMGVGNGRRNYPPLPLMRNEQVIEEEPDQSQLTKRYTAETVGFIEANKDQPFFIYLPHTFPHVPLFASDEFKGKSANGIYGDAVEEIDWSVGQIVHALRQRNLEQNTLVIFTSDNGAAQKWGGRNLPLKGFKGSTWEGGMRVPCLMKWPAAIPAGTVSREIVSTLDIMPTISAIVGQPLPDDRKIDGYDVSALLRNPLEETSPRQTMFYYYREHLCAVRHENFKLHVRPAKAGEVKSFEPLLFNLANDIGETRSIAEEEPEVVTELMILLDECRKDLGDGSEPGAHTRPPGRVEQPRTLTQRPADEQQQPNAKSK